MEDGARPPKTTPDRSDSTLENASFSKENKQKPSMLERLEKAAPYNLFFNTIPALPNTCEDPESITFTDLLCPSLGELKSSLQINFLVNIEWLLKQYASRNLEKKPLTLLYGMSPFDESEEEDLKKNYPNVSHYYINMQDNGCHHSKVGIYLYEDGSLRVVISSANLYHEDWYMFNQQVWVSPSCPRLDESGTEKDGESPTGFKASLLQYLHSYDRYETPILRPWLEHVKRADFGKVKVFLVSSTPGDHPHRAPGTHYQHVGALLQRHCQLPTKGALSWSIIAQGSSLGHYGDGPDRWLCGHSGVLLKALEGHTQIRRTSRLRPGLSVVFPTFGDVTGGLWGLLGATCLNYAQGACEKQAWLHSFLCKWRADGLDRSKAMPHQKVYCRISPCRRKLAWFLLTSANVTKSGWGSNVGKEGNVYVRNFEVGVLFFPQFFEEEYFEINGVEKNGRPMPFMCDLPLVRYEEGDKPWCDSYLKTECDDE